MTHRVAIVGAGPSGFYAADWLMRTNPDLHIDIIDRLPTPHGLIRAGVAPDHQGTKTIVRQFEKLLAQRTCASPAMWRSAAIFPGTSCARAMTR